MVNKKMKMKKKKKKKKKNSSNTYENRKQKRFSAISFNIGSFSVL